MINGKYLKELLGMNDTEIMIFQSLSDVKNVQSIANTTGISRTGINYCLSTLSRRGLIRILRNGKKKNYIALNEVEITNILQNMIDEIKISNPQKKGARIKTSKRDEFIIHIGADEIVPAYKRIAHENKNERIQAIQHHNSFNKLLEKISPNQLITFNKAIIQNHLIIDGILNKSAYQTYKKEVHQNKEKFSDLAKSLEGRMADYNFFEDNYFDYNTEIWLFKDTSLLINWQEEIAIEITNKSMTSFLRDMFKFVKENTQKIDHNQAMRGITNSK